MAKNDKSMMTQVVEEAAQMAAEISESIVNSEPIPFMKRKVSGTEVRREIEPVMKDRDYVKMQELIGKYGYNNVNETMGRIMSPKEGAYGK